MQRYMKQSRRKGKKNYRLFLLFILITCLIVISGVIIFKYNNQGGYQSPLASRTDFSDKFTGNQSGSADEEEWSLVLVNKWNPMSTDNDIETIQLSNGERVDKRIYSYLQNMFDDAKDDNVFPIVASGYRTAQEQENIYKEKYDAYKAEGLSDAEAKIETEYWVAVPGTSEHQQGLAVDINADGINSSGTEVYDWLAANAHHYGFINRYPSDKTELTGVAYEPWHYRYVGVKIATEIYNRGICLEEYLGQTNNQ